MKIMTEDITIVPVGNYFRIHRAGSILGSIEYTVVSDDRDPIPFEAALHWARIQGEGFELISAPELIALRLAVAPEAPERSDRYCSAWLQHITRSAGIHFFKNDVPYLAAVHSTDPTVNGLLRYPGELRALNFLLSKDEKFIKSGIEWAADHGTITRIPTYEETEIRPSTAYDPILSVVGKQQGLDLGSEYGAHLETKFACKTLRFGVDPDRYLREIKLLGEHSALIGPISLGGNKLGHYNSERVNTNTCLSEPDYFARATRRTA